ncbi:M16 family metallopeptidase [Bradymonas sediminis]|uniref:Insulinase family protein n=1 Tax=Bradymonas sediminis TaxID=1548548 RepID=A0A2Z4FKT2_9DELT|nr:pitrilysin family protein [Bradymonas sediminis]AWV89314.1 insulinase family protein [Bradymonas sediminis]TDP73488.1 putative Zn-dependent peptidase [Bradymonas sediminis]
MRTMQSRATKALHFGRRRASQKAVVWAMTVLLAACATLVGASTASAQDTADLIQTRTLENGLDVIVISDPSLPIITIEIAVKNGAFTETPELNGLSHLYEHMFFKANAVIPNQKAYMDRLRELGIVFNGTTSTERVNYFFTLPAANLKPGMEFMYNAITTTKFDPDEFEREKQVVIGEVDRNESSPYYWFGQAVNAALWGDLHSRKDSLGDRESVTNATVQQMQTMKDRYYVPNNSVLLIAGDIGADKAFDMAESVFSGWERGEDPFAKWPVPAQAPLQGNSYLVVERDIKVPYLQFSWHGPSVTEDPVGTYAADVLSFILSQPTSGFQKRLVETGLTLGAGISYYTQAHTGPINLAAQVPAENIDEALRAMILEVNKLANPEYFSDAQLQNAKTILAVQDTYGREKISSFAHTVSFWWATAGLDYYLNYVENLNAVTREDIAAYVSRYIIDKPYVMGVLLSPEQKKELGLSDAALAEKVEKIQKEITEEMNADEGSNE